MSRTVSTYFKVLVLVLSTFQAQGADRIEGKVQDQETQEAMPFVHVILQRQGAGTVTDVNGYYSVQVPASSDTLVFSYIGYETRKIPVHPDMDLAESINVPLQPVPYELEAVDLSPRENPAIPIIEQVIENRGKIDPEANASYQYQAYNRFYLTNELASGEAEKHIAKGRDSINREWMDYLSNHHFFMTESVINTKYLRPAHRETRVEGIRVSGFEQPHFIELGNAFRIMDFHKAEVGIAGRKYHNPIGPEGLSRYTFELRDTIADQQDTTWLIRFQPVSERFYGFSGRLYINNRNFVPETIIAETTGDRRKAEIRQEYHPTGTGNWFPRSVTAMAQVEDFLSIEIEPMEEESSGGPFRPDIQLISNTTVENLDIDVPLRRSDFGRYAFHVPTEAYNRDDAFWLDYRDALGNIDRNTYTFMDSLGKEHDFDAMLYEMGALMNGYLPWRFLNFDLTGFINFNHYEKVRLGADVRTNNRLSSIFSPGGYFAYGIGDEQWKYGGNLNFRLHDASDTWLRLAYSHDATEMGRTNFMAETPSLVDQLIRGVVGELAEDVTIWEVSTRSRAIRFMHVETFARFRELSPRDEIGYFDEDRGETIHAYNMAEAGLRLRYAFGERLIRSGDYFTRGASDFPVLSFDYIRGFDARLGDFNYNQLRLRMQYETEWLPLRTTKLSLETGIVDRSLPAGNMFTGQGSALNNNYGLHVPDAFQTMGVNEFFADRFLWLNWQQEIASWTLHPRASKPSLILWNQAGWANMSAKNRYSGINAEAYNQGFFETGLKVENILSELGAGAYYRYGPYAHSTWSDNLHIKAIFTYRMAQLFD